MNKNLLTLITFLLTLISTTDVFGQVRLRVRVDGGTASCSNCCDRNIWGNCSGSDPQWRVNIASQGWTTYPTSGICFTNPPNTQYDETYNCPSAYPANVQVCFRAFDDDGAVCVVNEDCNSTQCQTYAAPAPGASNSYTITIPGPNGSCWGNVTFTIYATGSWPGQGNDQICNAINLGTLPAGGSVGNSGLSNYNNYCASNTGDPNPWGGDNDQGVWFQFTTSGSPGAVIDFDANSDPQNFGDDIDLQLALYESSNNNCTGALTLIQDDYQGVGLLNNEDMSVNCLKPNTTYFLLVDGENTAIINTNGVDGFFGLQVNDDGIQQAADLICDAEFLGLVPAGGQVATPNLSRSNVCAGNAGDPTPPAWGPDKTVWFRFQAPPSGNVIVEADSDLPFPIGTDAVDLQLAVYGTTNNTCTGTLQHQYSDYTPGLFDEDMEVRCLTPGENYWVMVDGSFLNRDGIFDITVRDGGQYPAPNDRICDAIAMGNPGSGGTVNLNNQYNYCADNLFEPIPSNWGNDMGVWYTFIAPPSGKVEIRLDNGNIITGDNIDLQVAVYDLAGMVCTGTPTEIKSEHDGIGVVWGEDMEVECLIPGREYWILVDGEGSVIDPDLVEGDFDIEVYGDPRDPPAPNDEPCNAIALGDPTGAPVGTTPGAVHGSQNNFCADAVGEPQPSNWTADQTVWYTFVAPSTGAVNLQLDSDDALTGTDAINLQFAVYEAGSCAGPFREEKSGAGLIYDVDVDIWCLNPGQTYYLQVDGAPPTILGGHEGYFDVTLTEIPPIPVPPNDSICGAIALGDPWTSGPVNLTNQHNLCADDWGDPNPSAFGTDQTVWYSFTTPATGGPFALDITATSDLPWPFGTDAVDLQLAVFESSNNACTGTMTEMDSEYDVVDLFNESMTVYCLEPNKTYFLMVDGSILNVQGYFDLDVAPGAAVPIPTNDLICNYIDMGNVPIGGAINTGANYTNFCSDVEPGEPSPFGIDQTVWFSFVAPNHPGANTTSDVTISVQSDPAGVGDDVDLQLAVYASSNNGCTGALSLLEDGSDDPLLSFDADVSVTCLTPGQRYFVQVDGSSLNVEGYFQMQINDDGPGTYPTYDIMCNAVPLGTVPNGGQINNGVDYQNLCADVEPGEPNPSAFGIDKTVWFTFVAPASGNVTIDGFSDPNNLGDDIDLQLALYYSSDNTCTGSMIEVDSDHDGLNKDETLSVDCLEGGRVYYLQVDGSTGLLGDEDGYFTLRVTDDGGTSNFPYNNDVCNAFNFGVPGAATTLSAESNVCANVEPGEPGVGNYATHTVWYQFTAPTSGRVEIDVVSTNLLLGMDPEVRVFSSSNNGCNGVLTEDEVSNWPTALITENIEATCLIPGDTYFIQVDGSGLVVEGTFDITIEDMEPNYGTGGAGDPEPTNNACDSAIALTVQGSSCVTGTGTFQQFNYGQPTITHNPAFAQGCGDNCGDTWYQFTMPSTGVASIEGNDDAVGPGLGDFSDLVVATYTGTCDSLTPMRCDQGGFTSDVSFQVVAPPGTTVWVQVFNDGGDDDDELYDLCVSEGCGYDACLDALVQPILPNVPYCFNTAGATGENIPSDPGYDECSENDSPENSIYYHFVSDCNGSDVTLHILNGIINGNCTLGITPTDGFNVSLFQDATPCDNNPDTLVDCQQFTACDAQPINWSQTYTNLQPNTPYVVQIDGGFGSLGGDNSGEVMITTTVNPMLTTTSTPTTCTGNTDGTATTALMAGGVGPFTYNWSDGQTDSIATGLTPGTYMVTITGSNGCEGYDTVDVVDGLPMVASIVSSMEPSCHNSSDGQVTATATGGLDSLGYSYLWDATAGNQTNATATGLAAGNYTVTVYDSGSCSDTVTFTLGAPDSVDISLLLTTDASCNGTCDGEAIVTAGGGTVAGTYTFAWPAGQTAANVTGLCAGTYSVTATDDNGCTDSVSVTISEPLTMNAGIVNASGSGCDSSNCTGSADATITGGNTPYTYLWSTGNTNATANDLCPGFNAVTITDAGGCTDSASVIITTPTSSTPPTITPVPGSFCPNTTLTLYASGGVAGTGSTINWYAGPNGTGWLGQGDSLNITTDTTQTYYVRREGTCNNTADSSVTINVKYYVYGLNNATTNTYCTDNNGWHHFFIGDEIILSVKGDLSGAPAGHPIATITDDPAYHQQTQGPFGPGACASGWTPGEERFEMDRAWDFDFGGGAVNPPYDVRFYYRPAERTAIENAAINHMATYPACGYTYKYPYPLGFYWFKNSGGFYRNTPIYDGLHLPGTNATTNNGVNYDELTGITTFSGGSGAVILVPISLLPVDWLAFNGETDNKTNFLTWATASEHNTSHFNVQRSRDGINFHDIGVVSAQGNSTVRTDYTFDDDNPFTGDNYYRLELIDNNGEKTYSSIILLHITGEGIGYNFYPNPTNDIVYYQIETFEEEALEIEVMDVLGRTLKREEVVTELGLNNIPVSLGDFAPGSYMVRVHHKSSGIVHLSKIIRKGN